MSDVGGEAWSVLLEVSPQLGQAKLLLRRRRGEGGGGAADWEGGAESELEHRGWAVRLAHNQGFLHLGLEPPAGAGAERPASFAVYVGDGVEVSGDALRLGADHVSVALSLRSGSAWLAELLQPLLADLAPSVDSLRCRRCCTELVGEGGSRETYLLPTATWETCADIMACEECAPLGLQHVAPAAGRVYISPQCLVLSSLDLAAGAVLLGADGLARCEAGHVVGEAEAAGAARSSSARAPPGRAARKRLFCGEGFGLNAACRSRGVALYKHRVSMPISVGGDVQDALRAVTESSSIGAQLLSLRVDTGRSRFLLLPRPPDVLEPHAGGGSRTEGDFDDVPTGDDMCGPLAEALELRVVVPEVFLLGPWWQSELSLDTGSVGKGRGAGSSQRAAKVFWRRRSCAASAPECQVLVVPQEAFGALVTDIGRWAAALPPSHLVAPASSKDGHGVWRTSFLPLPPRESGAE